MFRASRWSAGNRLFPTQVLITPSSVVQYTPRWIGRQEETIHLAHVASVKINTGVILSNVLIETSGGSAPILCSGHTKGDASRPALALSKNQLHVAWTETDGENSRAVLRNATVSQ